MTQHSAARVAQAIRRAGTDAEFIQASTGLACAIRLRLGREENAPVIPLSGYGMPVHLTLCAAAEVWDIFAQPLPPVGFHSFTAAVRDADRLTVEGDPLHVAQSLHALERFFEILRGQSEQAAGAPWIAGIEKVTGHYARLGTGNWPPIYYDRSGKAGNPPILMLHTAGADARQYHHLLADAELQAAWNMHAFDMPAHGRSMPAPDSLWQGYRLDKKTYASICAAFIKDVIKRPALILGCSMGAAMALHMAKIHPELVTGVVALEAPYQARGRKTAYLAHPQTNQAALNPSYVRGLMSPASPLQQRRAAAWIYSQGGFQVYPGDLAFYSEEFDAELDIKGVDGNSKPIHLLTGAYDYSASPADSKQVADMIPGARFTEMPQLGHFPMIENPVALLAILKPVLQKIKTEVQQ